MVLNQDWYNKKIVSKFILFLVAIGATFSLLIFGVGRYLATEDSLEKADAIVAVSGGDTSSRTAKAIALYQQEYAPLLVFSGAAKDPRSPSNAKVMKEQALKSGVPAQSIVIDEASRDTKENAKGVKQILGGSEKIILVTSQYHQKRAHTELQEALPKAQIIDAPAKDKNWNVRTWWLTPYGWWITVGEVVKNVL